jgi:uncharacterized protein with HEPN domain
MRDDKVYLTHILESMDYIESFVHPGREEFFESRLIQDAVIRNLEIIGEAVKHISPEMRKEYENIPWREMAGLRDVLIHGYFGVDLRTVWGVVERELPRLKPLLKEIAEKL